MLVTQHETYPAYYRPGMPGYVLRDWEIVDYQCYELPGTGLWFRGPPLASFPKNRYFTAIGAAQTFGCYCRYPYPQLLAEKLDIPGLNLGYSGAGPSFFAQREALLRYINNSAFCVVQVMSGRSVRNSFLNNPDGLAYGQNLDGTTVTAEAVFEALLQTRKSWIPVRQKRLKRLSERFFAPASARQFVRESRHNWIADYNALLKAITVPKILFWYSKRSPGYRLNYTSRQGVFNQYPHLVNARMLDELSSQAETVVRCVSSRGSPHPLISRFSGLRTSVDLSTDKPLYEGTVDSDTYYPSPEMHADAADALEASCAPFVR